MEKKLVVLHTFNEDQRGHCKHVKLLMRGVQEANKDFKIEQLWEENSLMEVLNRIEAEFDWIFLTRNGFRGSVTKQKFVGHHATEVL